MTSRIALLFFLALPLAASAGRADEAETNAKLLASQPNGCGSGWTVYLTPNSIPLGICTFRAACDEHDGCYGKCEGRVQDTSAPQCEYLRCRKRGDLHGASRCVADGKLNRLEREAQKRRAACDTAIAAKINEINPGKAVCQDFAFIFENAVKVFGDQFFAGARRLANGPHQSQEDYEAAIREFFQHGTPAEFEAFNANRPDLHEAIRYEAGKGLVNR
jgi:hypothetical protein